MDELSTPEFMPMFNTLKETKCNTCHSTFEDIINTGMIGCQDCYDIFEEKLDPIIKKIQGSNKHIGRIGKIIDNKIDEKNTSKESNQKEKNNENNIAMLQEKLKKAIKEERYEDAAKIRDEIKSIEKNDSK